MNFHFKIRPFDIFYSRETKHYYVCIYTQAKDNNNVLLNDIYGLIVTTNPKYQRLLDENKNDYNVKISLGGVESFVCCDKLLRMSNDESIVPKKFKLNSDEVEKIKDSVDKFVNEIKRQLELRSEQYDLSNQKSKKEIV